MHQFSTAGAGLRLLGMPAIIKLVIAFTHGWVWMGAHTSKPGTRLAEKDAALGANDVRGTGPPTVPSELEMLPLLWRAGSLQ